MTLDELERLAREATPGPWISCLYRGRPKMHLVLSGDENTGVWVAQCRHLPSHDERNATFIAAMDPTTVLSLLRVVRAAVEWDASEHWPDDRDDFCTAGCPVAVAEQKLSNALAALNLKDET